MTANDRFKQSFPARVWGGLIVATFLHFAVLAWWPELTAQDYSLNPGELVAVELPPDVPIPEAPAPIARPATPTIATAEVDTDLTIAVTTFEAYPVSALPPPPDSVVTTTPLADAPVFTPYTVKPDIRNRQEVQSALEREYPPLLRDAGIGGAVQVWFFIDEQGKLVRTLINASSGHQALDQAALRVAGIIQFTPALNRDRQVPVWISLPITFQVRR
jgi:protein TonB